jgi:hypothetical protein
MGGSTRHGHRTLQNRGRLSGELSGLDRRQVLAAQSLSVDELTGFDEFFAVSDPALAAMPGVQVRTRYAHKERPTSTRIG